jgi:hypothetical protein
VLHCQHAAPTWLEATRNSDPANRVVHDFITVGLPAAHTMSFDNFGLESIRLETFGTAATTTTENNDDGTYKKDNDGRNTATSNNENDDGISTEVDDFDIINIRLREDIVFSQLLTAVVESFSNKIYLAASEERHRKEYKHYQRQQGWVEDDFDELNDENRMQHLEIMFRAGWLVALESLVTPQGNERGMLEDAMQAIDSLKCVELMVVLEKNSDSNSTNQDMHNGSSSDGANEVRLNQKKVGTKDTKDIKDTNETKTNEIEKIKEQETFPLGANKKDTKKSTTHSSPQLGAGKRRKKRARSSMIHPMFVTLLKTMNHEDHVPTAGTTAMLGQPSSSIGSLGSLASLGSLKRTNQSLSRRTSSSVSVPRLNRSRKPSFYRRVDDKTHGAFASKIVDS